MATAAFLLFVLLVFYVGGRIVLVHLMRDAETQVGQIGADLSSLAYRNAERVRRSTNQAAAQARESIEEGRSIGEVFDLCRESGLSLFVHFDDARKCSYGAMRLRGEDVELKTDDFAPYMTRLEGWAGEMRRNDRGDRSRASSVGLVRLGGGTFYISLANLGEDGSFDIVGAPFDFDVFSAQVSEGFRGVKIKSSVRRGVAPGGSAHGGTGGAQSAAVNEYGLVPMLSEALSFYSGGFWELGSNPFEASFAVRDIAGGVLTTITVSLPQTFSNVTDAALGRLTFFISMIGIVLILPVFWLQNRVLLNPLTKMTESLRKLTERRDDTNCPRLEWSGKDEFALLAVSVNRLLETIAARTVELGQLESRQRALISCIPDALAVFDLKGKLVSVIKTGEGAKDIPGMFVGEMISPSFYDERSIAGFAAALGRVGDTGASAPVDLHIDGRRGAVERDFEMRLSKLDDHFIVAVIRDITEDVANRKAAADAERRSHELDKRESLTLLAAGIAHDVNNVLSIVLGSAETLAEAKAPEAEIEVIRQAVRRGADMMKELRTFAGQTKVELARTNISTIIEDVKTLTEHIIPRNVMMRFVEAEDLPDVDVDLKQFWKVVFNIVKNAGEALGERPGVITIETFACEMTKEAAKDYLSKKPLEPGKGVLIRISDDGPGIAPELFSRMFDPYVSSKSTGRGLGLATVRSIVDIHSGGLRVESVPERGTTFEIYLPVSRMKATPATASSPSAAGELPKAVLVVDNDDAILKTCSILLKALKVKAYPAKDRHEALDLLRRPPEPIGAIVLDVHLGGIDTVRLLSEFREAAPGVRVVVSSGSAEEEVAKMFADSPYDAFLAKPYTLQELRTRLSGGGVCA